MSTFISLAHLRSFHASGHIAPNPALEDASLQENTSMALLALDPDVGPYPEHLPPVAATGVLLLEPNYVTNPYVNNQGLCSCNEAR